jgi:F-type H+-transporting ATPase subunit c
MIKINKMIQGFKFLGAGLATIGLVGAGAGVGIVFGLLIQVMVCNPQMEQKLFCYAILGFALTEAVGLLALMMVFFNFISVKKILIGKKLMLSNLLKKFKFTYKDMILMIKQLKEVKSRILLAIGFIMPDFGNYIFDKKYVVIGVVLFLVCGYILWPIFLRLWRDFRDVCKKFFIWRRGSYKFADVDLVLLKEKSPTDFKYLMFNSCFDMLLQLLFMCLTIAFVPLEDLCPPVEDVLPFRGMEYKPNPLGNILIALGITFEYWWWVAIVRVLYAGYCVSFIWDYENYYFGSKWVLDPLCFYVFFFVFPIFCLGFFNACNNLDMEFVLWFLCCG